MVEFTFEGFANGAQVALSVSQNGQTRSGSVASWGQSGVGSVNIVPFFSGNAIAPMPVWFEATNVTGFAAQDGPAPGEVYDPSFHEVTYVWTVTRPAGASGTYAPSLNMPDAWNNRNVAYGKQVAFVFDAPGDYVIDLWAIDAQGTTASASTTFTVGNPDTAFAGNRTILYDPSGVGDASRYPGANVQTTWDNVRSAREALGATPARILVKRGTAISGEPMGGFNSSVSNLRIGPWGQGADPVLGPLGTDGGELIRDNQDGANEELIIYGCRLQGGWDSVSERGVPEEPWRVYFNGNRTKDYTLLLHQCTMDGFTASNLPFGEQNYLSHCCYSESTITNWRDYGIYGGTRDETANNHVALIGMSIAQHPDALTGGGKNGLFNTHGAFRHSGVRHVYIGASDLFSRCGWSPLNSVTGDDTTADNSALRMNTAANEGQRIVLDRVAIEGSVNFADATGKPHKACNIVFDKVLHCTGGRNYFMTAINYGGTTVRNYLGVMLDLPEYHGALKTKFISFKNDGSSTVNEISPVRVYSSTFVDLRTDAHARDNAFETVEFHDSFVNTLEENFIAHAPNRNAPTVPYQPLDMTTGVPVFTPRHRGPRYNFLHESGTIPNNIPNGGSFVISYSDVRDTLYGHTGADTGASTSQAYWQANAATDILHKLIVGGAELHAEKGEFSVGFEANAIRITNTSASDWVAGDTWLLKLDRTSRIPDFESAYSSVGLTVPLAKPLTTSTAIGTGDSVPAAYDDFFAIVRPGPSDTGLDHLGNPRAQSGNDRGAILS